MRVLFRAGNLEVVMYRGEKSCYGLGFVLGQHYDYPSAYINDPEIIKYEDIVKHILKELTKTLGSCIEEFLTAGAVFSEYKSLLSGIILEAIRHLTMILASGVELQPSLTELGNRVCRILRTERKVVLKNSPLVKPYGQLYSFSKVIEVAAAIARLKDCHAIKIIAGMKKERGPDLRVVSSLGKEVFVEVTARRPSRIFETIELPMPLNKFLEEMLKIDLRGVESKIKKQRSQVVQADCIVVAGWHTPLGLNLQYLSKVKRVKDLRGVCICSSWTDTDGAQSSLHKVPSCDIHRCLKLS